MAKKEVKIVTIMISGGAKVQIETLLGAIDGIVKTSKSMFPNLNVSMTRSDKPEQVKA